MSRLRYDRLDLISVAIGGVLGAVLRWLIARADVSEPATGGWFTYAPGAGVTMGTNAQGYQLVRSAETISRAAGIPLDTLVVNLLGCLILGALTALLLRSSVRPRRAVIGAATGFCGSLTTFSTFAVELAILVRGNPVPPTDQLAIASTANRATALGYLTVSLAGGALAFWSGRRIVTSPGDVTIGGAT